MSTTTLLRADDLAHLPDDARYELIEGALTPMAPPGAEHGNTTSLLAARAAVFVDDHGLGATFTSETGFLVARDPDTVLAPDFAFVARERLPRSLPKTYLPIVPDLVLETRSPSDTRGSVAAKVARWLSLGVRLVWELDPSARVLTVHRPDVVPISLGVGETLDGGDVLPGFSLAVRRLFPFSQMP